MASESAILGWMLLLPAVGGGLIFALPQAYAKKARPIALAFLGATFVIACIAAGWFDWGTDANHAGALGGSGEVQLVSRLMWLQMLGASIHLGVDGLSMMLVLLASGMGVIACWASYGISRSPRGYFAMLLWLITVTLGVFIARDLLLLLIFFELMVPPIYFLIGIWGGGRKDYAASKFLLFALAASVALLMVVIGVYRATQGLSGGGSGVFDLFELGTSVAIHLRLASEFGGALFWLTLGSFAIWMGVIPLHTWLSDAIVEAPTPVAMLLICIVTKLGAYGIIRVAYPLFAEQAAEHWEFIAALSVVSLFYGALAALVQKDLRRMIAFASIAQVGYMVLGISVLTPTAMAGVAYQLVGHAITMGMLVFLTGMIADRTGHCDMRKLGGLAGHMPAFAGWSAVSFLSAIGLPGLCGFIGEFLILLGTFMAADSQSYLMRTQAVGSVMVGLGVAGTGAMILTGACFIWTYQRVFLGAPKPEHSNVARLSSSEKWILATFGATSAVLGVMPSLLIEPMRGWVETWVRMAARI